MMALVASCTAAACTLLITVYQVLIAQLTQKSWSKSSSFLNVGESTLLFSSGPRRQVLWWFFNVSLQGDVKSIEVTPIRQSLKDVKRMSRKVTNDIRL